MLLLHIIRRRMLTSTKSLSEAQAISIQVSRSPITAPVQGSALFSVDITCTGTPEIRWMFSSVSRQQSIAAWMLGCTANVTEMYEGRVQTHPNGSLTITDLRLQDSGYYTITVTEPSGNSKDVCMVLTVTGEHAVSDICTDTNTHRRNAFFHLSRVWPVCFRGAVWGHPVLYRVHHCVGDAGCFSDAVHVALE